MHAASTAAVLATFSKHDEAGLAALIVGVLVIAYGWIRLAKAAVKTALVGFLAIGGVLIVIGLLFFTRAI